MSQRFSGESLECRDNSEQDPSSLQGATQLIYMFVCVRVCVDLRSVEEPAQASPATAANRTDAHQHVHVNEQARRSGGEDHQTQSSVCW